jgi:hypothetical protein
MEDPTAIEGGRRCPACGALVSPDASWCGQCFTAIREHAVGVSAPATPSGPTLTGSGAPGPASTPSPTASRGPADAKTPTWPCPTCDHANAIDRETCEVCGTPFAALMRMDERPQAVDPTSALLWSLVFPGLGHRRVGRPVEGLARGILFAMLAGMAMLVALAGTSTGMLSAVLGLFVVFALVVYVGSALEAYRLAQGAEPLVSARALMWATVAVVMLSVLMLAMSVIATAKR